MSETLFQFFLISMPGGIEIVLIAAVLLFLFGGKKIPELMKGLGKGIREFKEAKNNSTGTLESEVKNTSASNINS